MIRGIHPSDLMSRTDLIPREAPEPEQSPSSSHIDSGQVSIFAMAAGLAWTQWSQHKQSLERDDALVLELAGENYGWLTSQQILKRLDFAQGRAESCTARLIKRGVCQTHPTRSGNETLYIFPQLFSLPSDCDYCGVEHARAEAPCCDRCGAPVR